MNVRETIGFKIYRRVQYTSSVLVLMSCTADRLLCMASRGGERKYLSQGREVPQVPFLGHRRMHRKKGSSSASYQSPVFSLYSWASAQGGWRLKAEAEVPCIVSGT